MPSPPATRGSSRWRGVNSPSWTRNPVNPANDRCTFVVFQHNFKFNRCAAGDFFLYFLPRGARLLGHCDASAKTESAHAPSPDAGCCGYGLAYRREDHLKTLCAFSPLPTGFDYAGQSPIGSHLAQGKTRQAKTPIVAPRSACLRATITLAHGCCIPRNGIATAVLLQTALRVKLRGYAQSLSNRLRLAA